MWGQNKRPFLPKCLSSGCTPRFSSPLSVSACAAFPAVAILGPNKRILFSGFFFPPVVGPSGRERESRAEQSSRGGKGIRSGSGSGS